MTKQEFFTALRSGLSGLPPADRERSIEFYSEMIDDRMEDGLTEAEAVVAVGSVEDIVRQIISETPLPRLVRETVAPHRPLKAWEIALLVLGAPLWLPLILAAVLVVFSVYIAMWSVVVSVLAVGVSLALSGVVAVVAFFDALFHGQVLLGILFVGGALACAGLSILLFLAFRLAIRGMVFLSKQALLAIKSFLIRKGKSQ